MKKFTKNMDLLRDVVTATNMNEIAEAVNRVDALDNAFRTGPMSHEHVGGVVRVTTTGRDTIPAFTPVSMVGAANAPTPEQALSGGERIRPLLTCAGYCHELVENVWGCLLEPLTPGGVARAMLTGVAFCKVLIKNESHQYVKPTEGRFETSEGIMPARIVWFSEDWINELDDNGLAWAVVSFSSIGLTAGVSCPGIITGGNSMEGYTATLYMHGFEMGSTGVGRLYVPEVACNNGFDLPGGTAMLMHTRTTTLTGGND